MSGDTTKEAPTRREMLTYGGAVVGGGLFAGCLGGSGGGAGGSNESSGGTNGSGGGNAANGDGDSYSASIEPVGRVTFEQVPKRWVAYKTGYGGMGIDLGLGDGLVGIDRPAESLQLLYDRFYSRLPGFELAIDDIMNIRGAGGGVGKEVFYEMDADVHVIDPIYVAQNYFGWSEKDVKIITQNVAPFFASYIRRGREDFPQEYEFYTLYEAFERVSRVFKRHDRYAAFERVHEGMLSEIAGLLSDTEKRPAVGLLNGGSDPAKGVFYPMDPTAKGYEMKQYRDLDIENTFAGTDISGDGTIDYEALLEVDPEIVIFHWGVTYTQNEFREQFVEPMKEHPVGQQLTAVENENIYPGGTAAQGPVINLFQTEMLGQQLYPAHFGAWSGWSDFDEPPKKPLFDRKRVADIINGDI